MKKGICLFFLFAVLFACEDDGSLNSADASAQNIAADGECKRYVDPNIETSGDGLSWSTAHGSLETAIDMLENENINENCTIYMPNEQVVSGSNSQLIAKLKEKNIFVTTEVEPSRFTDEGGGAIVAKDVASNHSEIVATRDVSEVAAMEEFVPYSDSTGDVYTVYGSIPKLRLCSNSTCSSEGMWWEYNTTYDNMQLWSTLSGTNTRRITIQRDTGNVGIGTFTPDYALDVHGTIRAEEVIVEQFTPDYVFGRNYDLMTLDEVEQYIQENSHLPGMQSARETSSQGVSIGEQNAILLQKVEELTLYVIEQNKKMKHLEAKLDGQK